MPRFPPGVTRDGWQIVKRGEKPYERFWLQCRTAEGMWQDYSGPYRGRHSALERYRRMELYELIAARHDPAHTHRFPAAGTVAPAWARRCIDCGLMIEEECNGEPMGV